MNKKKLKVLLVDDHRVIRDFILQLLEQDAGLVVVGKADNGQLAIDLTAKLKPDIVLMDVSMPDLNGIEATRRIIRQAPDVKVIAVSMYHDKGYVNGMFEAGAKGYILKDCVYEELINAIHDVGENRIYLSPKISKRSE